jgi:tRNA modification GTPase
MAGANRFRFQLPPFACDLTTLSASKDGDIALLYTEIKMNHLDTIAAISTPYGKGGIAVLRVSGKDAATIAEKVFEPASGRPLSQTESAKAVYGKIFSSADGKKTQIDDGIAVFFRAPRSFTGEDTVEISCHGGILVTGKVLTALLSAGARPAMAGEFTKRAFINGKMTLTSAEGLGDLLEAQTDEQISIARSNMRGVLSGEIKTIYDSLADVLSAIFAHIDYPDEDLADISRDEMLSIAQTNLVRLKKLSDTYSTGRAVMSGIPTVILGRTNAGKSSLYNRIVGRDAAIVTDIEGTTRDVLTETAKLGRVILRLSDTAGLRESGDVVERIGIDRARQAAESAELILAVFDGSRESDHTDEEFVSYISALSGVTVAIINKSDLGTNAKTEALVKKFDHVCHISAESGKGFDSLTEAVEKIYIDKNLDTGSDAIISNARQAAAVNSAIEALTAAIEAIDGELPLEICCSEVENTLSALGELDGRTVSEDIVSRIFANFCVGK